MSDAASDGDREFRRFEKERILYMEMMGREIPRRERVLASLRKFIRNKSPKNRGEFCKACVELNAFDAESFLDKLLNNDEETWASLLLITKTSARFNQFRNFSPFSKEIFTFDWDARYYSLVVKKKIEGKEYTRAIPALPIFRLPLEIEKRRWEYYRPQ